MKKTLFMVLVIILGITLFLACKESKLVPDNNTVFSKMKTKLIKNPNYCKNCIEGMIYTGWGFRNSLLTPSDNTSQKCRYQPSSFCEYLPIRSIGKDENAFDKLEIDPTETFAWFGLENIEQESKKNLYMYMVRHGEQMMADFEKDRKSHFVLDYDVHIVIEQIVLSELMGDKNITNYISKDMASDIDIVIPQGKYEIDYKNPDYPLGIVVFEDIKLEYTKKISYIYGEKTYTGVVKNGELLFNDELAELKTIISGLSNISYDVLNDSIIYIFNDPYESAKLLLKIAEDKNMAEKVAFDRIFNFEYRKLFTDNIKELSEDDIKNLEITIYERVKQNNLDLPLDNVKFLKKWPWWKPVPTPTILPPQNICNAKLWEHSFQQGCSFIPLCSNITDYWSIGFGCNNFTKISMCGTSSWNDNVSSAILNNPSNRAVTYIFCEHINYNGVTISLWVPSNSSLKVDNFQWITLKNYIFKKVNANDEFSSIKLIY